MASVELPGEDFPTLDTNLRLPMGQMMGNYLFGPGVAMNWGNHASTFGTNPELMGSYMQGGWYPGYQGGGGGGAMGSPMSYGGGGGYGGGAPPPSWSGGGYGGGGYASPMSYGGGGYGGGGVPGTEMISARNGYQTPIEGGTTQYGFGNNDFTHPGPPEWGGMQGAFASVDPALKRAQEGGFQATGPQYGGNFGMMAQYQPGFLNNQTAGSLAAYYGGQMPGGQGQGAFDRFNDAEGSYMRRYATGVPGQYPSWEQLTGERGAATLGGYDPSGNGPGLAQTGANTDIYRGFQQYLQSQGAVPGSSPFEQYQRQQGINQEGPNVSDITRMGIGGVRGAVDRGMGDVAGLRGQYELRGSWGPRDRPHAHARHHARGPALGRHRHPCPEACREQAPADPGDDGGHGHGGRGAGMRQMKMNNKDILDEATRNKNSILAQFQEANAQRQAAAIGRATDLTGAGMRDMMGYEANAAAQGMGLNANIYGQGMGLEAGAAEAGRQRLSSALGAGMDRASNVALDQQQRTLAALQAGDQAALQRQMGQAQIQGQGLQEYMGLQREGEDAMRSGRLGEMMQLEDYMRNAQQRKYDEMLRYRMMPMDWFSGMIGMPGGASGPISSGPNGWSQGLGYASSALNLGGSLMSMGGQAQRG